MDKPYDKRTNTRSDIPRRKVEGHNERRPAYRQDLLDTLIAHQEGCYRKGVVCVVIC